MSGTGRINPEGEHQPPPHTEEVPTGGFGGREVKPEEKGVPVEVPKQKLYEEGRPFNHNVKIYGYRLAILMVLAELLPFLFSRFLSQPTVQKTEEIGAKLQNLEGEGKKADSPEVKKELNKLFPDFEILEKQVLSVKEKGPKDKLEQFKKLEAEYQRVNNLLPDDPIVKEKRPENLQKLDELSKEIVDDISQQFELIKEHYPLEQDPLPLFRLAILLKDIPSEGSASAKRLGELKEKVSNEFERRSNAMKKKFAEDFSIELNQAAEKEKILLEGETHAKKRAFVEEKIKELEKQKLELEKPLKKKQDDLANKQNELESALAIRKGSLENRKKEIQDKELEKLTPTLEKLTKENATEKEKLGTQKNALNVQINNSKTRIADLEKIEKGEVKNWRGKLKTLTTQETEELGKLREGLKILEKERDELTEQEIQLSKTYHENYAKQSKPADDAADKWEIEQLQAAPENEKALATSIKTLLSEETELKAKVGNLDQRLDSYKDLLKSDGNAIVQKFNSSKEQLESFFRLRILQNALPKLNPASLNSEDLMKDFIKMINDNRQEWEKNLKEEAANLFLKQKSSQDFSQTFNKAFTTLQMRTVGKREGIHPELTA